MLACEPLTGYSSHSLYRSHFYAVLSLTTLHSLGGRFPGDNWRQPGDGDLWMAESMESKPGLNDECVTAYERNHSDWRICIRGAAALRYIKTPTFLLNSLYNWCEAYFVHALPVPSALWKTAAEKINMLENMLEGMHRSQLDAMAPAIDPSTPHGLFSDSCDAHVESTTGCAPTQAVAAQFLTARGRYHIFFNSLPSASRVRCREHSEDWRRPHARQCGCMVL
jgi:hypothetical protein